MSDRHDAATDRHPSGRWTVRELIEKLEEFPEDMEVAVDCRRRQWLYLGIRISHRVDAEPRVEIHPGVDAPLPLPDDTSCDSNE